MTVAFFAIEAGAALVAFWIFQDVERAGFFVAFVVLVVLDFVSCFISCAIEIVAKTSTDRTREK
jgi:hypothetical protein